MCRLVGHYAPSHTITVLTFDGPDATPFYPLHPAARHRQLSIAGASRGLANALANNARWILTLRRAIADCAPEVVVSFVDSTNVLTLMATRGLGARVIVSERIDPAHHPIPRAWSILRRLTYPLCHRLVVQTRSARDFFPPRVRARTRIIPNPLAVDSPAPAEAAGVAGAGANTVIAAGRLVHQKGFDLLLRAFARVHREREDWRLRIWGEGEERASLERLRAELGLQDRVDLPGTTKDLASELRASDLFVLSSRYEGFPNVLCEAMACALPVISFDCPSGPGEIIRSGVDGLLVPPRDPEALARAMLDLLGDEARRREMARRAPEILDRFGEDRIYPLWDECLGV